MYRHVKICFISNAAPAKHMHFNQNAVCMRHAIKFGRTYLSRRSPRLSCSIFCIPNVLDISWMLHLFLCYIRRPIYDLFIVPPSFQSILLYFARYSNLIRHHFDSLPNQISRAIWIITYHDYLYCTAEGNMVTLFYRRRSQMNFDRNGGKIGSLKWSINVWIVENVPK